MSASRRTAVRYLFPFLAALFFLFSCRTPSQWVHIRSAEADAGRRDVWRALRSLDLEQGKRHSSPEVVQFTEGLSLIINGRNRDAEGVFRDLMSSKDSRIRYYSDWALRNLAMLPLVLRDEKKVNFDTGAFEFPPSGTVELPIHWGRLGVPQVMLEINGRDLTFILDTGASFTAMDYTSAKRCGIVNQEGHRLEALTAVGSRLPVHLAFIRNLNLGGVLFSRHPVLLMEKKNLVFGMPRMVAGVDGVIGWSTLRHFRIEIDTRRRVVILSPCGKNGRERTLFWLGFPIVRARDSRGRWLHFGLDTGVKPSYITPVFLRDLHGRNERTNPSRIKFHRAWERIYIRTEVLPCLKLDLAGSILSLSNLFTMSAEYGTFVLLDGVIGFDVALENKVIVDLGAGSFEAVPWNALSMKSTPDSPQIFF